ncbi:hypothetical protein AK830_g8205 [Neonectria ditissima]|uniref:Uncharacterized protein n=1 Tax=Neonectria ditissima TaxID=78410 RepID=A0A0P7BBY9_9HYPO|nr:hypothetical protein AK830_g8205 [Neonectria ditissima]
MADPSTIGSPPSSSVPSLILDALISVFSFLRSIHWTLRISQLLSLFALPFRFILYPMRFVASVLLTLFAPAIYLASFSIAGIQAVIAFFISLEPLYTFFGAAAGVGIFAGIVVGISSSLVTSQLGMQDDDDTSTERPNSKQSYLQDSKSRRDSSSTELDWQWLDSPSHRRRPAAGLLSQTIHEEDDDSEY